MKLISDIYVSEYLGQDSENIDERKVSCVKIHSAKNRAKIAIWIFHKKRYSEM